MKKPEALFECTKCGAQTRKWAGRCLGCGAWSTIAEEVGGGSNVSGGTTAPQGKAGKVTTLPQGTTAEKRIATGNASIDTLLGGGMVPGAVVLLAGEPGVGKSTLLLALTESFRGNVLYVAGEESPSQIAVRATRLGVSGKNLVFLTDLDADTIVATIQKEKPALVIVDSIQTVSVSSIESAHGSPTQLRAAGATLTEAAKRLSIPMILVGQITKDGAIAGPKTLEHIVDVVLFFSGNGDYDLRMLRAEKNRFGSTEETVLFRMTEQGLIPEQNPSKALLMGRVPSSPGSTITCFLEGNRPLLVEVQALLAKSPYAAPVRRATGIDGTRLQMLLAVLEKRAGLAIGSMDVFVNVVGGMSLKDPGVDAAILLALASAATDRVLDSRTVVIGEIGLGGEMRTVPFLDKRLTEAAALGFTTAIVPDQRLGKSLLTIQKAKTLKEALVMARLVDELPTRRG